MSDRPKRPSERYDSASWGSAQAGLGGARGPRDRAFLLLVDPVLSFAETQYLYSTNDLAARVCDSVPEEALSEPWTTLCPDDKDLEDDISRRHRELSTLSHLIDAGIFARVDGDCFLFVDVDDRRGTLADELVPEKVKTVNFLRKVEKDKLSPRFYYLDPTNPAFGTPSHYAISATTAPGSAAPTAKRPKMVAYSDDLVGVGEVVVHESRFLKFVGARTSSYLQRQNNGWNHSLLQRIWRVLADFAVTWDAATHILKNSTQGVFGVKNLSAILASPNGERQIEKRIGIIDKARSVANSVIVEAGVETFEYRTAQVTGVADVMDRFASRVAAASGGIPVTKLFGTSPGGMNATGESDQENWFRMLRAYRRDELQPQIERLTRMLLAELGKPRETEWSVQWTPLDQPSAMEEAQLRQLVAQTDVAYIGAQVLQAPEVAISRFGGNDGYSTETTLDMEARAQDEKDRAESDALLSEADDELDEEDEDDDPDPNDDEPRQDAGDFDEGKHPRASDGKFGSGSGKENTRAAGDKSVRAEVLAYHKDQLREAKAAHEKSPSAATAKRLREAVADLKARRRDVSRSAGTEKPDTVPHHQLVAAVAPFADKKVMLATAREEFRDSLASNEASFPGDKTNHRDSVREAAGLIQAPTRSDVEEAIHEKTGLQDHQFTAAHRALVKETVARGKVAAKEAKAEFKAEMEKPAAAGADSPRVLANVKKKLESLQPHHSIEMSQGDKAKLSKAAAKVKATMTEDEDFAVTRWTGFSHDLIASADRGDPSASHASKREATLLRRMVSESEYDAGVVHRGISVSADAANKLLKSRELKIESMTSWSASESMARDFAEGTTGTAKSIGIPVILTQAKGRGLPIGGEEHELLVGKNEYKVQSMSYDKKGALRILVEPKDVSTRSPAVIRDDSVRADAKEKSAETESDKSRFGSDGSDIEIIVDVPKKSPKAKK